MRNIVKQEHYHVRGIVLKILQRWLEGMGKHPTTWATLIKVLRDVDLSQLANDIEKNL